MSKFLVRFRSLSSEGKAIAILLFLTVVPFLGLLPLFFFHDAGGYPLGAYPLGWLLGSGAGLFAYASIVYASRYLLGGKDEKGGSLGLTLLLTFARLLVYAIVLVIAAICTFKSEWFGGFNAFNFWTAFGGLLPMSVVSIFVHFVEVKAVKKEKPDEVIEPEPGSGEGAGE